MRDGLWRFDQPAGGVRCWLRPLRHEAALVNETKADAGPLLGRRHHRRDALSPVRRFTAGGAGASGNQVDGLTVSNGLAFQPDGATLYSADTKAHRITAFDLDPTSGTLSRRRVFAEFARVRRPAAPETLPEAAPTARRWMSRARTGWRCSRARACCASRPTVNCCRRWRCPCGAPPLPCFGGDDLRALYVTTSRENRPAAELCQQPLAGRDADAAGAGAGLPVNFARALSQHGRH